MNGVQINAWVVETIVSKTFTSHEQAKNFANLMRQKYPKMIVNEKHKFISPSDCNKLRSDWRKKKKFFGGGGKK